MSFTLDGTIMAVNRGIEVMLGWSREELLGQHYSKFITSASAAFGQEYTRRALNREQLPSIFAIECTHKDGNSVSVEARTRFIRDQHGDPIGFQGTYRDITERKQMEKALCESQERYRIINESISDYAFSFRFEPDGSIFMEWLTDSFTRITGYTIEELQDNPRPWSLYMHPDDLDRVTHFVRQMPPGQPASYEFRIITKDGERRWIRSYTSPVVDAAGRVIRIHGAAQDITTHKEVESQLRQAKEAAEAASRTKSEFVSAISHELRTPLSAIIGYTDLILAGSFGAPSDEILRPLGRVKNRADELMELITTVLDMGRLEEGRLTIEIKTVPTADLLAEIQQSTQGLQIPSTLSLVWQIEQPLPPIQTDPSKLKVIIKNLINNAVKFTEQGSVSVKARGNNTGVEIQVVDTGIGIPPDSLSLIFEPFRQVDSSDRRKYGGTGLGLHIVKRLLELLGGTISVESVGA